MIKTIIVEDELMARTSLENLCHKYPEISLVSSHENAKSALVKLTEEPIDLIFLDIEMPEMSGIELLEELPYLPQVVFTTGNKEYAYEAYEYDITDFLKKPISTSRFEKAVEKVIQTQEQRNAVATSSANHEIYIKSDGRYVRLGYGDIMYFENVGDYIKVVTTDGNYIFHDTLKGVDRKLKNSRFLKVHRSYIVNLGKIKDIEDNTIVIGNKVIPVSRAYKSVLLSSINII